METGEKPSGNGGRNWTDVGTNQIITRTAGSHERPGMRQRVDFRLYQVPRLNLHSCGLDLSLGLW